MVRIKPSEKSLRFIEWEAGNLDLEADWDTYVKEYQALKLDEYLQLLQTAYDAQYGK